MNDSVITAGDICISQVFSRKILLDILPDRGEYYSGELEQEDKFRFIAFLKKPSAAVLNNWLDEPFDPDCFLIDYN